MTRVVYWNNIPAPYVVERFNALARRGNLQFEAWFSARSETDRSWSVDERDWCFDYRYVGGGKARSSGGALATLARAKPDVLVSLYEQPVNVAAIMLARRLGTHVIVHAMRTFDTWSRRSHLREAAKRVLFPRVDGWYVPGAEAAAYVQGYGADAGRVRIIPEAVDVTHFAAGAEQERLDPRRRDRLGLTGCVFLYVGRLWRGKGLDFLLEAYRGLRAEGVDASLLLVGDGSDEQRYRRLAADLPGVVFAGFTDKQELPGWYGTADAFVLPRASETRTGMWSRKRWRPRCP